MKVIAGFVLLLRVATLTAVQFISFVIASILTGLADQPYGAGGPVITGARLAVPAQVDPGETFGILLLVSFLIALIFAYLILRSRWSGWKLVGALFLAHYGLGTVVSQLESIVYLPSQLPQGMVSKLFLMGAIQAGIFAPLAVLIFCRARREVASPAENLRLVMPAGEWAWKLAVLVVGCLLLYYGFGYFVAWKNPAVRAYYGGTDPGSFFLQMRQIWEATPWMFAFQALRALLWMAFSLPVIRMLKGEPWETAFTVALLYAVWSSLLLLPNPFMPPEVARTHLVETVLESFLLGALVGGLLSYPTRSGVEVQTGTRMAS